jgi:hypothetical protein
VVTGPVVVSSRVDGEVVVVRGVAVVARGVVVLVAVVVEAVEIEVARAVVGRDGDVVRVCSAVELRAGVAGACAGSSVRTAAVSTPTPASRTRASAPASGVGLNRRLGGLACMT